MLDRRSFVVGAGALTVAARAAHAASPRRFPAGFVWGAATAAHQIEGNNINSDCWMAENAPDTTYLERSGDAANSFELWPTDLDCARAMGLNAYRFSLEWARIEPEPGQFSLAMLDHYKAIIAGCHARGLTPIVTFNHFTTPRWFALRGGWMNDDAPALLARFCDRAARHMADGMGYATTLNEPNLAGLLGEVLPPDIGRDLLVRERAMAEGIARRNGVPLFLAGNAIWLPDPARVQANLLRGHAQARAAIKAVRGDLPVGVSLAMIDDQAAGPGSRRDAVRERLYGAWLRAVRHDDFVGVQNYARAVWTATGQLPPPAGTPRNDAGQEIYPASLAGAVRHAHDVAQIPIMVTEHGVHAADDTKRAALIPAALAALHDAMNEGVPVLGYCHWSLIDNYEWGFGYGPRFGLHSVDHTTFVRTAKPSAAIYGAIARANAV